MSRLVVVSNRVADLTSRVQSGGLAVAIEDALREAHGVWFGWDGTIVDDAAPVGLNMQQHGSVRTATVPLTRKDYEDYYLGYSNTMLWPAFHNRLDLVKFDIRFIEGYRKTNQRFARQLSALLEPDDTVWIHDYQLIPLAAELRGLGIAQRIGFFLHIPFPPPDIFLAITDHEWLARSLFSNDVVGFQTAHDRNNFIRYVIEYAGGTELPDGRVKAYGRTIQVGHFPIGIDAEAFYQMAHADEANEQIDRLQRRNLAAKHIIGVDRLDYTKGLPDRLRAYRRLLELYPENRKSTTLMQIAPPTREDVEAYSDIREELERLSGAINGAFGDFDWTPVRYIHRAVPRATLAALFRGSRVGLVTPLRDGMNLVAKEYVAAQDELEPGVLVLSRFAGAAEDLEEAVLVNPYDIDDVANAMQTALNMRREERLERHAALLQRVRARDVTAWRRTFLKALASSQGEGANGAAP